MKNYEKIDSVWWNEEHLLNKLNDQRTSQKKLRKERYSKENENISETTLIKIKIKIDDRREMKSQTHKVLEFD